MNNAMKAALINTRANPCYLKTALFHSTPFLHRRRRHNYWDHGGGSGKGSSKRINYDARRFRRQNSKQEVLLNVSEFAEHLFQSWHGDYNTSSSQESSWFHFNPDPRSSRGFTEGRNNKKGRHTWSRRNFEFCEDEFEVETIFRSTFSGGSKHSYWSFTNEEPKRTSSRNSYYKTSWNSSNHYSDEDEEGSSDSDNNHNCHNNFTEHRATLGLKASGPLNLDDVKNAYRACALKWHPDRHQGSSKGVAEEKFKVCSAAYQSLCHKLAVN